MTPYNAFTGVCPEGQCEVISEVTDTIRGVTEMSASYWEWIPLVWEIYGVVYELYSGMIRVLLRSTSIERIDIGVSEVRRMIPAK